jgi:hypothetical protein
MSRSVLLMVTVAALSGRMALAPSAPIQEAQPIVRYPLNSDLNDATASNAALIAKGAVLQTGRGLFCNGDYILDWPDGCDVRTPVLSAWNLSAFTIKAQFLIPTPRVPPNTVFVAGSSSRWLSYQLRGDGSIRLAYNNSASADCSVKYRIGFWHEAAITFDGRTIELYLDGVRGCRLDSTLDTHGEKVLLLTNYATASTFYGLLRELTVYNAVVVPARHTPEADAGGPPGPSNLSPADEFLATCPSADVKLSFESDPTSREPLACTAAQGSRNLSPLKKRVYNTLLLAKRTTFDQPLPWTKQPLYEWLTSTIKGVRFRSDINLSSCCNPPGVLGIAITNLGINQTERWIDPAFGGGGLSSFLALLVHEARHAEGAIHTCGTRDRTLEEMGSWSVQYHLLRWFAEHTDRSFFSAGTRDYNAQLLKQANTVLKTQICGG